MLNWSILLITISISLFIMESNGVAYFPPPLKQISNGVLPENVTCSENFSLIIKITNELPACVNHSSVDKLIQRGWASVDGFGVNSTKAQSIWENYIQQQNSDFEGEYIEGPTEDGYEIIHYKISGDHIEEISSPELPNELIHLQKSTEKHYEIWNNFTSLIPESDRNVSMFYLTTDGVGEIAGGVNRDLEDLSKWHLFYDIYDSYPDGIFDENYTIHTTIHEFGHILTSSTNQLDVDAELVELLVDNKNNFDDMWGEKSEECYPKYMSVDGCVKDDSYMDNFYQQFWLDIISEWDEIQYIENDDEYYEHMDLFYEKYEDRFVSAYASSNVDEDIAESWTAFVLLEKPQDIDSISNQKILFFYEYPELIELRYHIRSNL